MCNCIKETEERLRKHMIDQLTERNLLKSEDDVDNAQFKTSHIINDGNISIHQLYSTFYFDYYRRKKDGSKYANLTKEKVSLIYNYCPFCGEKIKK